MSKHDPNAALRQMRDHAQEALHMIEGRSRGDLDTNRMLNLSSVRLQIGFRTKHGPFIPAFLGLKSSVCDTPHRYAARS